MDFMISLPTKDREKDKHQSNATGFRMPEAGFQTPHPVPIHVLQMSGFRYLGSVVRMVDVVRYGKTGAGHLVQHPFQSRGH